MTPRWRELPFLAWVLSCRLSGPLGRYPVLGVVVQLAEYPGRIMELAVARSHGIVAAVGRTTVACGRPVAGFPRTARIWLPVAGVALCTLFPFVGVVCVIALPIWAVVPIPGTFASFLATALGVTCVWAAVAFADFAGKYPWSTRRHRREVLARARAGNAKVLVVTRLASRSRYAHEVTAMVRATLRTADLHDITLIAWSGSAAMSRLYARIGFRPVPGSTTILVRQPRTRTDAPAAQGR